MANCVSSQSQSLHMIHPSHDLTERRSTLADKVAGRSDSTPRSRDNAVEGLASPGEVKEDRNSHLQVKDYIDAIITNLRKLETKHMAAGDYVQRVQRNISHNVRTRVIDWLIDIGEEHNMNAETIYLTVNYLDRFLSDVPLKKSKLQLFSVACMFIASKYEELYPPSLSKLIDSSDDSITKKQIVEAENIILNSLNFSLTVITPLTFLNRLVTHAKVDERTVCFAMYLMELLLQEPEYLFYKPSMIASSALCLSMYILDQTRIPWTSDLQLVSGYSLKDMRRCIEVIFEHAKHAHDADPESIKAVREKYLRKTYHRVSDIRLPQSLC